MYSERFENEQLESEWSTGGKGLAPWWAVKGSPHNNVFAHVHFLDETQGYKRSAYLHWLRLYSNRAAATLRGIGYSSGAESGERIRINVTKSAVDTATAMMGSNRPRPMYMPQKGNYTQRQKAEAQNKFIGGQFYRLRIYDLLQEVFLSSAIFGSGWLRICQEDDNIAAYNVFPDNVIFDDNEAVNGCPRQLFQYDEINKERLCEEYPKAADKIREAGIIESRQDSVDDSESLAEMVSVIEAWHLPSGPDANDGRHVLCIGNCTLIDEEYEFCRFPLVKWDYRKAARGYLGMSAVEELSSIQMEINYLANKIQKLMTLATSMAWVQRGSGITRIDNKDWAVREYSGNRPPTFQTTSAISAEYFHHLERLKSDAFEIVGVSRLQAQSVKPAGLDSGEALRVYNDIGSARYKDIIQRWENFVCRDVSEAIHMVARQLLDQGVSLKAISFGDKEVESINFKDAYMEEDTYVIQCWPTNLLPDSPAGQVETIATLAQAMPTIQPHLPKLLTGLPDLKGLVAELNAPMELAQKMIYNILDHGEFEQPDPRMDLQLLRQQALLAWSRAHVDGYPDDRIELLERFISSVDNLQFMAQQGMMMEQQAMQAQQAQQASGVSGIQAPSAPQAGPVPGTPGEIA